MNTLALLPNLAGPDMLIIFMIVLIMFGAKKLPELAKGLGQAVKEFSKAKEDVNSEFNRAAHYEDPHLPAPSQTPPAPVSTAVSSQPVSPTSGSNLVGSSGDKPHA